ncbi:helicase HerA domain-containing protein [Streptantibioticus silvisoli]|uniref:DUF87 domain-containing protein n=1 Tax=Streptantibioticus silvisoli TaxID=2705255 RepID=A0ABT6VZX5_9ACTN|nr:DUF87 domain-containing protein [Streptantibioticus silvisoli]MDI5964047.1 DUF87 domain-containing protein [Streptantibioticus silvisoli]
MITPLHLASLTDPRSPVSRYLRDPGGAVHSLLDGLGHAVLAWGPVAGPSLAAVVTGLFAARAWWRSRCRRTLASGARLVEILPPPAADPNGAAALWSNLVGVLRPAWRRRLTGQPHLAWEYVFDRETIRIRIWVPGVIPPGMVERAIEAAWPGAHTKTTAAPPLTATPDPVAAGGELRLARSEALPIRTDFPADPIRALLGAPAGLGGGEKAVVQVLARPVTGRRVTSARRAARHLRVGHAGSPAARLLDLLAPGHHRSPRRRITATVLDRQTTLENAAEDRVIIAKQRGTPFETRVRYAVFTTTTLDAAARQATEDHLRGRAHAIASAFAGFTEHNYYRRTRLRRPLIHLGERRLDKGDLLSIPELAVLAHLPWDEAIPALQRAGARAVPPPPGVATCGPGVRPIGVTDTGNPRPVGLRIPDARHHLHILGATGSGKSELMARMILDDAEAGRGVVVVDPKSPTSSCGCPRSWPGR